MRTISDNKQSEIKTLLRNGLTCREVSVRTGVGLGTVSRLRQSVNSALPANDGGRSSKISKNLGRLIMRRLNTGEYKNAAHTARQLSSEGYNLSPDTIRRFLHNAGWHAFQKPKLLPLTKMRKQVRFEFAKTHRSWTVDDWKRVVFSDETKINRLGSDGAQWTWKATDAELRAHNVEHLYKHGGGSIMAWGCFM